MSRIARALALLVAALVVASVHASAQCDRSGDGDICASGSAWFDFTRLRVQPREKSVPAMTTTLHTQQDLSIDFGDPKGARGRLVLVAGRALLLRAVPHEKGYEIDALDGAALLNQLVLTLLDQAFPGGPGSVPMRHRVRISQKTRAIIIATTSASGRFEAPWTLAGTVQRRDGRVEYDLRFSARTADGPYSFEASGFWTKESSAPLLDERMPLDGWSVHLLGPMTMTSTEGTTFDYATQSAADRWTNIGALRTWIAEEPARRASRRAPVDPANPGPATSISYEAFETDKTGTRKPIGTGIRHYRSGLDVLAEDTQHGAIRKALAIGDGLSLSTDVYRAPALTGFGLVLDKDGASCFSWEWFDKAGDDVFSKLRGDGRLKVSVDERSGSMELASIEFLDDVTLGCEDRSRGTIYEALIKKGSVLRLRP